MSEQPAKTVWPALRYDDAPAALRFLVDVFGFQETLVVPVGDHIGHAELRWPEGGGVMFGSTKAKSGGTHDDMRPGVGAVYVVTDDVEAVYRRVQAAGAEIAQELHAQDHDPATFTARDPEGNLWSFGTYRGA